MANWMGRVMRASSAAYTAFTRTYADPSQVQGGDGRLQRPPFELYLAYFNNSLFHTALGQATLWARYKGQYKLYRDIRALYNPTRRLCDTYASLVYPGFLSADGKDLPNGTAIAIPLGEDTPPELAQAIAQFWRWSNWQQGKSIFVRYGAIAGSVLVEVIDDLDRGKVTANIVWPANVVDITLDAAGNVKGYALEYTTTDDEGISYLYRKEVDPDEYRTFKDGTLFDYTDAGQGPVWANPYGFVPAVWCKHRDLGTDYGRPAMDGTFEKVDELNSLASHLSDQVHKVIAAPAVIAGDGSPSRVLSGQTKRGAADEFGGDEQGSDRENLLLLKAPAGTTVHSLAGNLDIPGTIAVMQQQLAEIEQDIPEVGLYRQLRAMSQVTGPAAARLMGDVVGPVTEAMAAYDRASMALFGMAVAIGGMRIASGDWPTPLTRQQQLFAPFDLSSYARGDLDFSINPRPLIPLTEMEELQLEQVRQSLTVQATEAIALRENIPG